jgi:hypothetical protein
MREVPARLLDVTAASAYLGGICADSVRALVAQGVLVPVRMPSTRRAGESSRRLLFAREDLDKLIDRWKAQSSSAPNAQLSAAAVKGWRRSPQRFAKKGQAAETTVNKKRGEEHHAKNDRRNRHSEDQLRIPEGL